MEVNQPSLLSSDSVQGQTKSAKVGLSLEDLAEYWIGPFSKEEIPELVRTLQTALNVTLNPRPQFLLVRSNNAGQFLKRS